MGTTMKQRVLLICATVFSLVLLSVKYKYTYGDLNSSAATMISRSLRRLQPKHSNPTLDNNDIIYHSKHNTVPIVNEEYKVVFFQVAKAASSQWVRFFMRLNNDPDWCEEDKQMHSKTRNHLKYLSDFPIEKAQEMMTSPEWTRAIFVRHPKPRLLSAFLDKAVNHTEHFTNYTCPVYAGEKSRNLQEIGVDTKMKSHLEECIEKSQDFSFFLYNITRVMNKNVHWRSISSRVDKKWWPYINFVGYMDDLSNDAERFLKKIRSGDNVRGQSAWDTLGKTGWSTDERDCSGGTSAFLAKRHNHHQTSARDHMLQYYSPKLENFMDVHYADDTNNHFFHFENDVKLYHGHKE